MCPKNKFQSSIASVKSVMRVKDTPRNKPSVMSVVRVKSVMNVKETSTQKLVLFTYILLCVPRRNPKRVLLVLRVLIVL